MSVAYTYDDFLSAANSSGLLGQFSQADLDTAMKYPEFGLSILSLKKDYRDATTDEQRLLANEAANQLRSSYGNYMGGSGGSFYSQGKLPGQIDDVLDRINGYGSFSFDEEAPVYNNQYAEQQQALLDAILNREDFSWSKENDPQWSSYKKSYLREGDRAAQNALAQASAASGGRPSTAAVTAASQAGDYYAAQLNDIIPTLYQQAYDRYLNEYSMMLQDLGAVNSQEKLDYAKYLDQLGKWNTDRNFAYENYLNDFDILQGKLSELQGQDAVDYNRYMDQIALDMEKEELEYNRGQDSRSEAQAQVDAILAAGGTPSQELIAASGYSGEYIQSMKDAYQQELAASLAAGGGSAGGSAGSGGYDPILTYSQVMDAIERGNLTPQVLDDYRYYMGADYDTGVETGEETLSDMDTSSVLGLGIGPVSFETLDKLVEEGKVEVYTNSSGRLSVRWAEGYNRNNYKDSGADTSGQDRLAGSYLLFPGDGHRPAPQLTLW